MCLFKDSIVYRICQYCGQEHVYGCHNLGELRECQSCVKKCYLNAKKLSEVELKTLRDKDSLTYGACNDCQHPEIIMIRLLTNERKQAEMLLAI